MLFLFNRFILLSIFPLYKHAPIGFIHSTVDFSTHCKKQTVLYQPDPSPAERLFPVLNYYDKVSMKIHIQIFVWICFHSWENIYECGW